MDSSNDESLTGDKSRFLHKILLYTWERETSAVSFFGDIPPKNLYI